MSKGNGWRRETFPDGEAYNLMRGLAARFKVILHAGACSNTTTVNTTTPRSCSTATAPSWPVIARSISSTSSRPAARYIASRMPSTAAAMWSHTTPTAPASAVRSATTSASPSSIARWPNTGVAIITIPAAFTMETGKDHWEVLCRARAIETQTYVLAPNQVGKHPRGHRHARLLRPQHGRRPLGSRPGARPGQAGFITARLDFPYLASVRQNLRVHDHHVL